MLLISMKAPFLTIECSFMPWHCVSNFNICRLTWFWAEIFEIAWITFPILVTYDSLVQLAILYAQYTIGIRTMRSDSFMMYRCVSRSQFRVARPGICSYSSGRPYILFTFSDTLSIQNRSLNYEWDSPLFSTTLRAVHNLRLKRCMVLALSST